MIKLIITIISFLSLFSCVRHSNQCEVISIKSNLVDSICIHEILGNLEYVSLESGGTIPLVGRISKILFESNHIFISDSKSVHCFGMQGDHINTLNRYGRGPGEYLGIADFCVLNKYIYILDNNNKLYVYSLDGECINTEVLDFYVASMCTLPANKLLLKSAYQSDVAKFHIYDSQSLLRLNSFAQIKSSEITWRHIKGADNFYYNDKELLFHEQLNDTVYSISDNIVSPKYVFDFYGKNAPSELWDSEYKSIMDIVMKLYSGNYCFGTPTFAETDDNLIFAYKDGSETRLCVYNKVSKTSIQSSNIYFDKLRASVPFVECIVSFFSTEHIGFALSGIDLLNYDNQSQIHFNEDDIIICYTMN